MPAEHDLDPDAMTEKERLAKRRYEAYYAFETQPQPTTTVTIHKRGEELSFYRTGDGPVHVEWTLEGVAMEVVLTDAERAAVIELLSTD